MAAPAVRYEQLLLILDLPGLLQCPLKKDGENTAHRAPKKMFSFLKTVALHQRSKQSCL